MSYTAVSSLCLSGKGLIAITDGEIVTGVFTDGDFRRAIASGADLTDSVDKFMSKDFNHVDLTTMCTQAIEIMSKQKITALPIMDTNQRLISVVNISQIHEAGIR